MTIITLDYNLVKGFMRTLRILEGIISPEARESMIRLELEECTKSQPKHVREKEMISEYFNDPLGR